MIRALIHWLSGRATKREERQLRDAANSRRSEALAKVKEAERRGDTRDLGRALMIARQATADALRMELGR